MVAEDCLPVDEDREFWEEFWSLLIQMSCLIERKRLDRKITTADLRKAGKKVLCDKDDN